MSINELTYKQLFDIFGYLRLRDLARLLLCSHSMNKAVIAYLSQQPLSIHKQDTLSMAQPRVLSLMSRVRKQSRLEICCLNIKLSGIMKKLNQLAILKLHLIPQHQIRKTSFWYGLLQLKSTLCSLTIGTLRENMLTIDRSDEASDAYLTQFFDQMVNLRSVSYKISDCRSLHMDVQKYSLISDGRIHSAIINALLTSKLTKINKLKLKNMIMVDFGDANTTNTSIEQVKIQYEDPADGIRLPANSIPLRLTNTTFIYILNRLHKVRKIVIDDSSNKDDKFLCSGCTQKLQEHYSRNRQPIELQLSSFKWHWSIHKVNLFELCSLPVGGQLISLRSLFSFDADAVSLIANSSLWNFNGLDISYTNINDDCFEALSTTYSGLQHLSISGCKKLSKERLMQLSRFNNLKSVCVQQLHGFTNSVMNSIIDKGILQKIKLKKNKVSGDTVERLLRKCKKLNILVMRSMNSLYDDFHFRWLYNMHSDKTVCESLQQLDISYNERFSYKMLKKLKRVFPNLVTLKMMGTMEIDEKDPMIHENVQYLSAVFNVSRLGRLKQTCLRTFPKLLILNTQLSSKLRQSMQMNEQRDASRLLVYDHDGQLFTI